MGYIGKLAPLNEENKDISSIHLLNKVSTKLLDAGYKIVNIDLTYIGEEPRLEKFKKKIEENLAKELNYKRNKIEVLPEDIIVTTGASEALAFTLNCICDAGDEIIIPEPFYANYNGFAAASSVKVIPIVSLFDEQFCLPSISTIENKITTRTKAILICNPSNPTG